MGAARQQPIHRVRSTPKLVHVASRIDASSLLGLLTRPLVARAASAPRTAWSASAASATTAQATLIDGHIRRH